MKSSAPLVFLIAHPDDLEHSMGGTALLLRDRYPLHIICATKGERGIKGIPLAEAGAIRQKEQEACAGILGAELTFLDIINGELHADAEICARVSALLKKLSPRAVFTLWPINNHPEHTAVFDIAVQALHQADLYYNTEIYMSENAPGTQTNQFEPDMYVDISKVIEQKRNLARCHISQNTDEEGIERTINRSRIRGTFAGCEFAEGFKMLFPLTANGHRGKPSLLMELGKNND